MMKSQSAVEYLILIGFVTLAVTIVLLLAYFYANMSDDKIRENQINVMSEKIIDNAESVFYSGMPSQVTIKIFVPKGISSLEFIGNDMVVTARLHSGDYKRVYTSKVVLSGSINSGEGTKNVIIRAEADRVSIG